mmetsp:Transcript_11731/g.29691  ORF Transcript_11731/g.29691 Transcript_11731/m.29691 type:complete len:155 (+) Transcript_11731:423-887(+)
MRRPGYKPADNRHTLFFTALILADLLDEKGLQPTIEAWEQVAQVGGWASWCRPLPRAPNMSYPATPSPPSATHAGRFLGGRYARQWGRRLTETGCHRQAGSMSRGRLQKMQRDMAKTAAMAAQLAASASWWSLESLLNTMSAQVMRTPRSSLTC